MISPQVVTRAGIWRRREPYWIGLVTVVLLALVRMWNYAPPLPSTERFTVYFDEPHPGDSEPLIATGETGDGNFLYVHYLNATTLAVGYDRWGRGGSVSDAVAFAAHVGYTLELELPALQSVVGNSTQPEPRVRVKLAGRTLIDEPANCGLRKAAALWFGVNPIGGTSCGEQFHGRIIDVAGVERRGNVATTFTLAERWRGWLRYGWPQVGLIILAGLVTGCAARFLRHIGWGGVRSAAQGAWSASGAHWPFLAVALGCTIAFGWILTCGSGRFTFPDGFGNFYDYQAMSLMDGRLDVPDDAIGIEAFIHDGKRYGYFGLTPALQRLPLTAFGVEFGRLTRPLMLVDYVAALIAAYLLLLEAATFAEVDVRRWLTVLFTASVGLGSTLLFLSSRAYVYHEAILCGAAFALWGVWCALRYFRAPESRWWWGALMCGVLSVHARPPTGLYALTVLTCAGLVIAWRTAGVRKRHLAIATLAIVGALSFNALSYAKFKTFNGCPVWLNVQYDAKRLARIDGRTFHLSNLGFTSYTYLWAPNLLVEPYFPWLFLNVSKPDAEFPRAKMDYADRTLAMPYAMTGLSLLAVVGIAATARRDRLSGVTALIWMSSLPMAAAMLAAVAISHRYTADFCPFLISAAACGVAAVLKWGHRWRIAFGTLLIAATLWSVALNAAITLHYQGAVIWGTPDGVRENYQRLQQSVNAWFAKGRGN